ISSFTGGLSENRPSQYALPLNSTAGKMLGTAHEARMCSTWIAPARGLKLPSWPVRMSAAPISSAGPFSSAPQRLSSPKSRCASSSVRRSVKRGRIPAVAAPNIAVMSGEDGLRLNCGTCPLLTLRSDSIRNWLNACSAGDCAVFSCQKSMMRRQGSRAFLASAYQASAAQIEPPEVPDRLTMLKSRCTPSSNSAFNTPAVKAVWLPPPWQAMAILSFTQSRFLCGEGWAGHWTLVPCAGPPLSTTAPAFLERLQLRVDREAAGLLAGRKLLERRQELADELLRRHQQEDVVHPQ